MAEMSQCVAEQLNLHLIWILDKHDPTKERERIVAY